MGRNILLFIAVLGFASPALAQDIYGNSAQDLYGSPVSGNEATATTGAAIEQNAAQEEAEEAARQEARKQKRITRYEKQKKAFLASALTVGLVGGAGGIGTGAAFLAIAKKQEKRRSNPQVFDSMLYLQDLETSAAKNKKISYIAFGVGGAAAVTSIVLGAMQVRAKHKLEKAQKPKVTLLPAISPEESSLTLALNF